MVTNLAAPVYTEEDHRTWAAVYAKQLPYAEKYACRLFLEGMPKLALNPNRLPDPVEFSQRLLNMTGWSLADAQNEYLGPMEWFEHLAECRFPVTNYIRRPHEIDFTPLPDLFHEYFGHLAYFTDPFFADTAQMFGDLYLSAKNERQQLEISRLWWFTTEFGLIREEGGETGGLKAYGAGLMSGHGELMHAFAPETLRFEFDIRRVAETPSAVYSYHPHYFILDDYEHIRRVVFDYARMEGLPEPEVPHR
jgi:phenylalanine-4-hydroxylase